MSKELKDFNWSSKDIWKRSAKNTAWCVLGCSIGDFGTILFFQYTEYSLPVFYILSLAIVNGLITSIILETIVLSYSQTIFSAFKTAIGMSFISMISMELAMNLVDYIMTGGAIMNFYTVLPMLIAGYFTPLPYNYYRLKKYNQSCH